MRSFIKEHWLALFILLLICLPIIFPLILPGVIKTDDGEWLLIRFTAFYEALRDGQFPVRWVSRLNNGLGYPVIHFLYPGYLYLSTPFYVITRSYISAIEMLTASTLVISAWGMYLWLKRYFTSTLSVMGAVFYLYAPYHIYDFLKRGSLGELLSLSIIPFVFYFLERKQYLGISLSIALLLLAHNTLAALFMPIIGGYILLTTSKDNNSLRNVLLSFLVGFGLAAFFWLPALYDLQYTVFSSKEVSNWKNYATPLHLIGLPTIAIIIGALYIGLKKKKLLLRKELIYFAIVSLIAVLLSIPYPKFLWEILPIEFVQFPFRLLSVVIVAVPFLTAAILHPFKKSVQLTIFVLILFMTILLGNKYYSFEVETNKDDSYFATNQATTTVQNEYLPRWAKEQALSATEIARSEKGKIENSLKESHKITFQVSSPQETEVVLNQLFFPGWHVFIDGLRSEIKVLEDGRMGITVPNGVSKVEFKFERTPIRVISDTISLVSSGLFIFFILKSMKRI